MQPLDGPESPQPVWPAFAMQVVSELTSRRLLDPGTDPTGPAAGPRVGTAAGTTGTDFGPPDQDLFDAVLQHLFAVAAGLQAAAQRLGRDDPAATRLAGLSDDLDIAIAILRSTVFEDGAFSTGWIQSKRLGQRLAG